MASYQTGVIGFPLRLLARENYERLVALKGPGCGGAPSPARRRSCRARARYFSCTVEAMSVRSRIRILSASMKFISAPIRSAGIFLPSGCCHARGIHQTMFMGADTIKPLLLALIPKIEFIARPRLSQLSYNGFQKMTRLPKRSAVVAFSIEEVYAIAELIRRQRGGTAVVLGALSPRTGAINRSRCIRTARLISWSRRMRSAWG